ncbi:MAG: cytochrome c [Bacteroidota bacterium]
MTRFFSLALILLLGAAFFPVEEEFEESKKRGKELYEEMCVTCHMGNGEGLMGAFPPIAKSDFLTKYPLDAIRAVKYGQSGEITVNGETYNSYMPEPGLEDQEIADVMNYIRNAWGNQNDTMVTATMVAALEKE